MVNYLKNDKIQRIVYVGILLLWVFVGVNFLKFKYSFSQVWIDDYVIAFTVIILLIGSIAFNKKTLWIANLIVAFIHALWTTYKIVLCELANFHSDYIPSLSWKLKNVAISTILILVSFLVTWIIWKMKPLK